MMISAACFGAEAVFLNKAARSVDTNLSHRCQGVSRAGFIESHTNRPDHADIAECGARGRVSSSSPLQVQESHPLFNIYPMLQD